MLKITQGQRLARPEVIPTPSFGINYVLGGGIWSDRITALWGNFSSGKTTFALMAMAIAQAQGFTPIIVDTEGTYTDEYAEKCGINVDERILLKGTILEDILKALVPYLTDGNKYIILIDSLNGIFFEAFNNKAESGKQIGTYASAQKFLTAKLESYMNPNLAVIYIAQQSWHGLGGNVPLLKANIGNYVEHMCCNIIRLFCSSAKDAVERDPDTGMILDQEISWTIEKSKQSAVRGVKGTYWWNASDVFSNKQRELFHYAVRCGVIHKGGARYTFRDKKGQGEDKFLALLDAEDWEVMENSIVFIADNAESAE